MTTTIEKLAIKVSIQLLTRGIKLTTIESCTGGGLSFYLTNIAGSSDWFERGFVSYSNEAKQEMLGVQAKTLSQFGAVSAETASEMAKGGLMNSHADVAISITGVAGPTGGSKDKPVGTVWIGWADKNRVKTISHRFMGDREQVRLQTIEAALTGLLTFIQ